MQKYDDPQVIARLAALKTMTVKELKAEWSKLMGSDAPNNSSQFMIQRLSYRIQELAFGGMSKPLVRTLDALADEYEGKKVRKSVIADPRNPIIGTRLVRGWNGTEHTVTVMKDGFDWNGQRFKSLSAIAKTITGTNWNGYRFFGLRAAERGAR
ncbi:DUF2924 domain-containing protein [Novosphingobium sp. NPDC080210]|uniref:DUF2924 domain-containing protein n=1 Tax=Novosphingobium sp. NPDC080210 TaxID=3390596 RepID=UPI003CFD9FD3